MVDLLLNEGGSIRSESGAVEVLFAKEIPFLAIKNVVINHWLGSCFIGLKCCHMFIDTTYISQFALQTEHFKLWVSLTGIHNICRIG